MWQQIKELELMAVQVTEERSRCAIETKFPHIARELCTLWQTQQIDLYLDDLLLDSRGERQGFPQDVMDELMFLSGMRWHMYHPMQKSLHGVTPYSFAGMNETALAYSQRDTAWVL